MRQYANSPIIQQILEFWGQNFNADIEEDFYNLIWNIETASTYGLDVWGRIVGVGRYLTIEGNIDAFGFETAGYDWDGFDQSPFYPQEVSTDTYRLADDAYRQLILAKAMANIFGRSAQDINKMLRLLFGNRGKAYVLDLGDMSMRYVFEYDLEPYEKAIVSDSGVFGRPAGVLSEVKILPDYLFGFDSSDYQGFDQGTFWSDS